MFMCFSIGFRDKNMWRIIVNNTMKGYGWCVFISLVIIIFQCLYKKMWS